MKLVAECEALAPKFEVKRKVMLMWESTKTMLFESCEEQLAMKMLRWRRGIQAGVVLMSINDAIPTSMM